MNSLNINIDILGQHIYFRYQHREMDHGAWSATIVDECKTIKEILLALSPDECLDAVVPFLFQLGNVVSITSADEANPYVLMLQDKLANATRMNFS